MILYVIRDSENNKYLKKLPKIEYSSDINNAIMCYSSNEAQGFINDCKLEKHLIVKVKVSTVEEYQEEI